ncbi:MAG TPA: hypothetical protein V6C85_23735 [Allocoleopsis sp.]
MVISGLLSVRGVGRTKAISVLIAIAYTILSSTGPAFSSVDKHPLPIEWSIPPLTNEQLAAVRACDIRKLESDRYPTTLTTGELLKAHTPNSDCDWAVLAWAYAKRTEKGEAVPEQGKLALAKAIANNPGFVLASPIFSSYFGEISLVKAPPFARREITAVKIEYQWGGLGEFVGYTVNITQANAKPVVSGTAKQGPFGNKPQIPGSIDKNKVQALAPALTDLLPIDSQFEMTVCTDNYPNWTVSLTFEDGTTLELVTQGSNFMYAGGPWQTKIGQQNYVQYSPAFIKALSGIVEDLKLPWGRPAGMACGGRGDVLKQAFPAR